MRWAIGYFNDGGQEYIISVTSVHPASGEEGDENNYIEAKIYQYTSSPDIALHPISERVVLNPDTLYRTSVAGLAFKEVDLDEKELYISVIDKKESSEEIRSTFTHEYLHFKPYLLEDLENNHNIMNRSIGTEDFLLQYREQVLKNTETVRDECQWIKVDTELRDF